jgi:two-component system chemotaxis response regulator CheY
MQRDMIKFALRDGGHTDIIEASTGEDALKKANEHPFDLIITDINMPGMNGFELVKQLRRMAVYEAKPILVLTTESTDEMKLRGKAAGATGWIIKPFAPAQLIKAISIALSR